MTSVNPLNNLMERRLRIAGIFVLLGLLVEVVTLRWVHPAAFLVFALIGIPIAALGILIYLYSVVSVRGLADGNDPAASSARRAG
jgi:hypothetical protein